MNVKQRSFLTEEERRTYDAAVADDWNPLTYCLEDLADEREKVLRLKTCLADADEATNYWKDKHLQLETRYNELYSIVYPTKED